MEHDKKQGDRRALLDYQRETDEEQGEKMSNLVPKDLFPVR